MNSAELKLQIFRQIDSLEKNNLEGLIGLLTNYINGKKDLQDWNELSNDQKLGIVTAISEIDSNQVVTNKKILSKYRKKYSRG